MLKIIQSFIFLNTILSWYIADWLEKPNINEKDLIKNFNVPEIDIQFDTDIKWWMQSKILSQIRSVHS